MKPFPKIHPAKIFPYAGLLVWLALTLVLPQGPGFAEEAAVPDAPPVLSAAEIDYPPFSVVDAQGRPDGFSVELLRASLAAMNRKVTFRTGPWDQVKGWLEKGQVEALPLVGRTPEREHVFDFTFPYMSLYGAIVVRKETNDISEMRHLAGRRVEVMKGDNAEEYLRRKNRGIGAIITTKTFEEAFHDLSQGKCDAVVIQRLVALRLLQQTGLENLKVIGKPIEDFRQDFCFAVKKGDAKTLAMLNEGLSLVMADGTFRHLHAKWFAALEIPTHRRIIVGGDQNYRPYEYLDENGRSAGYNVELVRAVAQEVGIDIEFRLGPWSEVRNALANGEIDIIQGMFYSEERDLVFDFSPPHTVNHCVSVVRRNEGRPPATLAELSGKRIVVEKGDIMHDFSLEHGLGKNVTALPTQEEALEELSRGKYDCALVARVTALYHIKKNSLENLTVGTRPLLSQDYCFAVKNGQRALLAQFSEGLKAIEDNGEYRRIYSKWMGVYDDSSHRLALFIKWSKIAAIPLVLVLLAVLFWIWALRRQVARRTTEVVRSERLLATIIDAIAAPVFYKNVNGVYLGCNKAFSNHLGFSREDIVGKTAHDLAPSDLARVYHESDLALMAQGETQVYEAEVEDKSGNRRQFMFHKSPFKGPDGGIEGLVGAMLDITERKKAEEAIKLSEDKFRSLFTNMAAGCCLHEIVYLDDAATDYRILDVNPAFESILGVEKTKAVGALASVLYGTGAPPFLDIYAMVAETGEPESFEVYFAPIEKYLHVTASSHSKGRFSTIFTDITERKQTEARIEHLNRVLLSIRDVNQLIVREHDPAKLIREGCRLLVENRGYASALMVLVDEIGRPASWAESGLGESLQPVAAMLEEGRLLPCFEALGSRESVLVVEDRQATCEGCPIVMECAESRSLCIKLFHEGSLYGYLAVALDSLMMVDDEEAGLFSEMAGDIAYALHVLKLGGEKQKSEQIQKLLEEQLFQAQKMESVGLLAGGVAHDFNNQLGVILGHAELALSQVDQSQPIHDDLVEIRKAAQHSADLTKQLLAFARRQTIAPKVLDFNETVEGMLKMLRRLIGEDIKLAWKPGAGLWPVKMDPAQLDQVLANLCINARDAIAGVGRITIETGRASFDDAFCAENAGYFPGDFVSLSINDSGTGMDAETLARIFEPFFTTKGLGQGTGLGLATVYGIMKQNKGFIIVKSQPGAGSTFTIYLPKHSGIAAEAARPVVAEPQKGGGETLLLVEDEPAILNMAVRILKKQGYNIISASDPHEAVRLAESYEGAIDLLITDVVMPEMNGKELAEKIMAMHPEIRTLYMSGYTADVIADRGVLDDGLNFLQKPFSMQELTAKVRAALDEK